MARSTMPALLVATASHAAAIARLPLHAHHGHARVAPVIMQASFGSDEGGDVGFSVESRRRMAERLNSAVGLPQNEPALDEPNRPHTTTGIPFIDTHFPSRRDMLRDARSKLGDVPRIEVHIDEYDSGCTVSMKCDHAVDAEQLEVALQEGVLMLVLEAADASAKVLVPVPLPADLTSAEIATVTHEDGKVTVRVVKGPNGTQPERPGDAEGSMADDASDEDVSEEEVSDEEVLDRLTRVLKAFGLSVRADEV